MIDTIEIMERIRPYNMIYTLDYILDKKTSSVIFESGPNAYEFHRDLHRHLGLFETADLRFKYKKGKNHGPF